MRGGKEREVVWAASGQVGVGGLCLSRNQTGTRRRKKKNQAKQRSPSSSLTNPLAFSLKDLIFIFCFVPATRFMEFGEPRGRRVPRSTSPGFFVPSHGAASRKTIARSTTGSPTKSRPD